MTELLDKAVARLRQLPSEAQDNAAESILAMIEHQDAAVVLAPEQVEQVRHTREGLKNGTVKVASDAQVEAMWRRLGA